MKIYDALSKTELKYTGTPKLMHAINPHLFIMWDEGISKMYGCFRNSVGYINFMKLMQEQAKLILQKHKKRNTDLCINSLFCSGRIDQVLRCLNQHLFTKIFFCRISK